MPRNPDCRKCGLWQGAKNVCVWGDGSSNARVVAIGEAPGEAEAKTGRPFMGRSGQLLRSELSKTGLDDVYITNIVKCRPPDNRDPTPDEIKACRPYLEEELSTIKPDYVLTLGKPSTKEVLGSAQITAVQGQVLEAPKKWAPLGFKGVPAFHPAYVLRDPSKMPQFQKALERLRKELDGEQWDSEVEWELVTAKTLRHFVAEFERADEFSFDLETSSLFPQRQRGLDHDWITSINIGLHDRAWIIPMQMKESPLRGRMKAQLNMGRLLAHLARGKTGIAHNGKFDCLWLYHLLGFTFYLGFDTMLAHHTLDENNPHDLEWVAHHYLDAPKYDIPLKEKQNPTNLPQFYSYTGKDAVYTLRLKKIFDREFKRDSTMRKLFYKLVMPAARTFGGSPWLEGAESVGYTLNLEKFDQTGLDIAKKRDELERDLNIWVAGNRHKIKKPKPWRTINWNSPAQVGPVLFDEFKIKPTILTPKGKPSTSEAAIIELKGKHPVIDALVAYREMAKFHSTYIEGFREHMINERLYISTKIHGTVTGRYSSRLHSIPRDGTIRNLVEAPEGWDFLQGDFSQAELRIAAELSGDLELRRCFAPGGPDVHWSTLLYTIESGASGEYVQPAIDTASKILGRRVNLATAIEILRRTHHDVCIEIWKGWKEARKRAKAINFGFLYGMYPKKFIETCKIKYGFEPTYEEAEAFREAYFAIYTGLPPWHDKMRRLVSLDGFVRSLSGRMRRLPGIASSDKMLRMECERQAINSPVQGFIGDLKAMAMVEIHETIPHSELRVLGEHHDAILMQIRRSPKRIEVVRKVKQVMEHPKLLDEFGIELTIPIEAELEVGPWGAGKKLDGV
jgi:uracil-DNA glycosylase family 4